MRKNRFGLAVWLAAVLLLAFFENNTGTRAVALSSLLLPLCSVICAWLTARSIRVKLTAPTAVTEGQPAEVRFELTASPLRYGCAIRAQIDCRNTLTGQTETFFAEATRTLRPNTAIFGVLQLNTVQLTAADWFGLVRFPVRQTADAELTVRPALYPVNVRFSAPSPLQPENVTGAAAGRTLDETMGVRPYVSGDPIRLMHWKLSARLDEPMVRETGKPQDERILLLLDSGCDASADTAARLQAVKGFLSTAQALCADGYPFLACTPSQTPERIRLQAVTVREEFDALTDRVLRMPVNAEQASVGTLLDACSPETRAAYTVLFAAGPHTDCASLYHGQRITLVLPHAGSTSGCAEFSVQVLNENQTDLEI